MAIRGFHLMKLLRSYIYVGEGPLPSAFVITSYNLIATIGFSRCLVTLSAVIVGAFALPAPLDAEPNFTVRSENSSLSKIGKAPNYNQNYIATGASVAYTPSESAGNFSVKFNTRSDFVVGLGWQPGDNT
jgi:hypothetical protein